MSTLVTESDYITLLRGELPNIDQVTPLIKAAANGDTEQLRKLCKQANFKQTNNPDPLLGSPIIWAAHGGHIESIIVLLEAGAWPNVTSALQGSPLYQAVIYGYTECVGLLMAAGADPQLPLPNTLAPHYEFSQFVCLKENSKRDTAATIASKSSDQRLKGYIKLDSRYPLPSVNLPNDNTHLAQLQQWINFWVDDPKNHTKSLLHRINNLRSKTTLHDLSTLLSKQTLPRSLKLWKTTHQHTQTELLNCIEIRTAQLKRIEVSQPSHQLDAMAGE